MNILTRLIVITACSIAYSTSSYSAIEPFELELLVIPKNISLDKHNPSGKLLIAWQVTNVTSDYQRFRTRDLGKIKIFDPDGVQIIGEGLGVDHTKQISRGDYPVLAPAQTLYFPFAVAFKKHHRLGLSLEVRHDPNGQEGLIFKIPRSGKYKISCEYSVKKNQGENLLWDFELETIRGWGFDNFWEGNFKSGDVELIINLP